MELKQLAAKPQLVKVTIDSEDIITTYGEALDFYTWDRQPMDTFLKVAAGDRSDFGAMVSVLKDMVLDSEGNPVIVDGLVLPPKVLMAVFTKLVEQLGK